MQATARITFQVTKGKRTKDALCPVKLMVTHKRVQKYYSILHKLKENKWQFIDPDDIEKVSGSNPRGKYKDQRIEYDRIAREAEDIIKGLSIFSFNLFEDQFTNKAGSWDNVFAAIWSHSRDLRNENRLGYASSFESTLRAIKEFHTGKQFEFNPRKDKIETRAEQYLSGKSLQFQDITVSWLKKFERSLVDQDKSETTIGIHGRNIRRIVNLAISEHGVKCENPFPKYQPASTEGRKMALEIHEIVAIMNYKSEDPRGYRDKNSSLFNRDLFIMSFFCSGMNTSDLSRLRWSNIQNGQITFTRFKTRGKTHKTMIAVEITQPVQEIINRIGIPSVGFDGYVLPVLQEGMSEPQRYAAIKQQVKVLNRNMKKIAHDVGIKQKVSSYSARHSFATILADSGVNHLKLRDLLGHSSVNVTEKYVKSIGRKSSKEIMDNLVKKIKRA